MLLTLAIQAFTFQLLHIKTDPGGRYIVVHADIASTTYVLVGLYLPPPTDMSLLYEIMQQLIYYDTHNVILIGDINLAPCPTLDRLRPLSRRSPDLLQWATTFELVDAWRHCHPADRMYTCHSAMFRTLSHIDLVFVTRSLLQRIAKVQILPRGISDHSPLMMTVLLGLPVGRRMWRQSGHWLVDSKVQEDMPEALCNYWLRNENIADPGVAWDAFKGWLRGEYISRITNSQKHSVQSLEDLERELKIQEDNYVADPTPLKYGS